MHFSGLGDIYLERREFVQAAQTYRQALELDIHDIRQRHPEDYLEKMGALYLRLSQALIELGHRPAARTVLQTFIRINPQNAIIHDALQDLQSP
jgi:tetratricopeptide (TPR) repeat protein